MAGYTNAELQEMVQPDRVHRAFYTDPAIFEIEMEKIFRRVWLYVGHESLVPNPGDYYCTHLARQPVVLSRHKDDGICVLFNRCGHRGAKVLNRERGNAKVFTCMYHGWSFRPNGALAGVPMRADFPEEPLKDPQFGMAQLPRVESYRGFVFASFNADAEPLLEYLAEARRGIDELVDRSPEGEVALSAGCHRYHYRGNWKLQLENLADMYHPAACHASTIGPDGRQFKRRAGAEGGDAAFFAPNGEAIVAQTGVRGLNNRHSSEASLFDKEQSGGHWDDYRAIMVARHGEERTADILKNRRHSMTFFPSSDILLAQTSVRVIRPVAVDFTEGGGLAGPAQGRAREHLGRPRALREHDACSRLLHPVRRHGGLRGAARRASQPRAPTGSSSPAASAPRSTRATACSSGRAPARSASAPSTRRGAT